MEKYIFMFLVGVLVGPAVVDRLFIDSKKDISATYKKVSLDRPKSKADKNVTESPTLFNDPLPSSDLIETNQSNQVNQQEGSPLLRINFAELLDEAIAEEERNDLTIQSLLSLWAKSEPDSAFVWVFDRINLNPEEIIWEDYLSKTLSEYVAQDPESAGESIKQLPVGELKTSLVQRYVRELTGLKDPDWIQDWVDDIENFDERQLGLQAVAESYATNDPQGFFDFLEDKKYELDFEDDEPYFKSITRRAAYSIGENIVCNCEFDEIITGANEISQYPTEAQTGIAEGMIAQLMQNRPEAVGQLTDYLPRGEFRDESIQQFIVNDVSYDSEYQRLADLTIAIDDGYLKTITAATIISRWQEEKRNKWWLQDDNFFGGDDVVQGRLQEIILSSMP